MTKKLDKEENDSVEVKEEIVKDTVEEKVKEKLPFAGLQAAVEYSAVYQYRHSLFTDL